MGPKFATEGHFGPKNPGEILVSNRYRSQNGSKKSRRGFQKFFYIYFFCFYNFWGKQKFLRFWATFWKFELWVKKFSKISYLQNNAESHESIHNVWNMTFSFSVWKRLQIVCKNKLSAICYIKSWNLTKKNAKTKTLVQSQTPFSGYTQKQRFYAMPTQSFFLFETNTLLQQRMKLKVFRCFFGNRAVLCWAIMLIMKGKKTQDKEKNTTLFLSIVL